MAETAKPRRTRKSSSPTADAVATGASTDMPAVEPAAVVEPTAPTSPATDAAAPTAEPEATAAPAAPVKRPRSRSKKARPAADEAAPKPVAVKLPPSLLGTTIGSGMEFRPGAADNPPLPPPVAAEERQEPVEKPMTEAIAPAPEPSEAAPQPRPVHLPLPTPPSTLPQMSQGSFSFGGDADESPAPRDNVSATADEIFGARAQPSQGGGQQGQRHFPPGEPVGFNGFGNGASSGNNGGNNGERRLSRRERWLERRRERQQAREAQNGGFGNRQFGNNGRDGRRDRFGNNNGMNGGRDNRPQRQLTPEEQAQRDAQRAAGQAAAAAQAEERAKLALPLKLNDLQSLQMSQLRQLAEHFQLADVNVYRKHEWIFEILKANARCGGTASAIGVVDLVQTTHGLLRSPENNYAASPDDVYLGTQQVRQWGLRTGDMVEAQLRPPRDKERFFAVDRIVKLNGVLPTSARDVIPFENLRPVFPDQRLRLEVNSHNNVNMRVMDLLTPIGKGQRGLIVAPPRTGKTVLMQMIANSISENNPEVRLIILLIDERPEEVTDMERNTKAEVISSTFDEAPERHAQIAELVIEMAKREVEHGKDVVILLDSITRLARAYNTTAPHSGRIMSGGIDANAMHMPKKFFGAARNIEGGGSLTIIATALVDTGSRMDEVIFEEFKGTGNMEVCLDRSLVDKRIFPAINIEQSGTRKEELLTYPDELSRIWTLRKALSGVPSTEAMELLIGRLKKTRKNAEFLMTMQGM